MQYKKLIFVTNDNFTLGPMAEWMMKDLAKDRADCIFSKGLVVLFSEPMNEKVGLTLAKHHVVCGDKVASNLTKEDLTEDTCVLTMTFAEKVKVMEGFDFDQVFTIMEFLGDEGDVVEPYDSPEDEDMYEETFVVLGGMLEKVKEQLGWGEEKDG